MTTMGHVRGIRLVLTLVAVSLAPLAQAVLSVDWSSIDASAEGIGSAVAISGAGNIYVVGSRSQTGQGLTPAIWAYSALGSRLFAKTPWALPGDARAVAPRPGGVVVVGGSMLTATTTGVGRSGYVCEIDSVGATVWFTPFHGPANGDNSVDGVAVAPSGNIVVTGRTTTSAGGADLWVAMLNPAGTQVSAYAVSDAFGREDAGLAVAVDSAGSIYVTGYVGLPGRLRDLWVSKLDPTTPVLTDASPAWPITLNVPTASTGYGSGIALDPQDNIVVAGAMTGPQGTTDAYLAKIAVGSTAVADGTVLWARTIDGGEQDDDLFTGVLVDPSGNLWATGGVDRPTGAFLNIWIAEFAADGSTLFSMDQDGTGHDDDIGHGIVRDAQGILYLAGETNKSGIGRIMFVERLHWYPSQAPGTSAASPGFKAAPNPYKPGHGGPQDAAGITFGPVDPGSTVRIYTITGSLVAEVTDGDGDGIIVWNAKSPNGAGAASGVYLYVVIPPKGAPFRGKVVIVR